MFNPGKLVIDYYAQKFNGKFPGDRFAVNFYRRQIRVMEMNRLGK